MIPRDRLEALKRAMRETSPPPAAIAPPPSGLPSWSLWVAGLAALAYVYREELGLGSLGIRALAPSSSDAPRDRRAPGAA